MMYFVCSQYEYVKYLRLKRDALEPLALLLEKLLVSAALLVLCGHIEGAGLRLARRLRCARRHLLAAITVD